MSRPSDRFWGIAAVAAVAFIVVSLAVAPPSPVDRTQRLAAQLRCPVCQSESVADSPSETARQMRALIAEQVAAGYSDQEILAYFVDRYGTWILLDPPPSGGNAVLWMAPAAALLVGGLSAVRLYRRSRDRIRRFEHVASPTSDNSDTV